LPVQPTNPRPRTLVTADGEHLVSHAGSLLLVETADTVGLTNQLGRRANLGRRAGGHDRGVVLRDLLVMLADGGDGFGDLAALRDQPELFGQVASTSTVWRVVAEEVAGDPRGVAALWSALARARETAWALGAAPPGPLVIDIDATLVTAHSDKQGAAPTFKRGFGFHPLVCYLDRGDGTGEALSGILRPGNAGSNTAADHLDVLAMALVALPKAARTGPILVRADSAGATHPFVEELHRRGLAFSIGFPLEPAVKQAILAAPVDGWLPARDQDDHDRPGAWVCELDGLDLAGSRHAGDLPPRTAPPGRQAEDGLHRPGWPSLPGVHHQPA
jgi:DDE family transposase